MRFHAVTKPLERIDIPSGVFLKHKVRVYNPDNSLAGKALLIEADLSAIRGLDEIFCYMADLYEMDYGCTIECLFDEENNCLVCPSISKVWYLELLQVEPEYRGTGLGAEIYSKLESELGLQGLICLYSYPLGNRFVSKTHAKESAKKVLDSYSRMGFASVKGSPHIMWKHNP